MHDRRAAFARAHWLVLLGKISKHTLSDMILSSITDFCFFFVFSKNNIKNGIFHTCSVRSVINYWPVISLWAFYYIYSFWKYNKTLCRCLVLMLSIHDAGPRAHFQRGFIYTRFTSGCAREKWAKFLPSHSLNPPLSLLFSSSRAQ